MKRYVIFAGVNGAGKTTLYQTNTELKDLPRINLDEIVREIGDWRISADVNRAGKKAVELVKNYLSKGISFNQETTLCGRSILTNIKKAKELHYRVEIYFVGLSSPELAIERVNQRVKAGGHGIPEQDIQRRYHESIEHLQHVMPICDYIEIYDNTETFYRIATFEYGICVDRDENIPVWCKALLD